MEKRDRHGKRDRKHGYSTKPRKRKAWNKGIQTEDQNERRKNTNTSAKKLNDKLYPESSFEGFRIFDIHLLRKAITDYASCKLCGGELSLKEESNIGLGGQYSFNCSSCANINLFYNSNKIGERNTSYEINHRSVLAMRMIGNGLQGLRMFCGVMDLPSPIFPKSFDQIQEKILKSASEVAQNSMKEAVEEEIQRQEQQNLLLRRTGNSFDNLTNQENNSINLTSCQEDQEMEKEEDSHALSRNLTVKGDGTWQKRGHTSLNGAVSLAGVNTDKILDHEVLTSYCKICYDWRKKNGPSTGDEWTKSYEEHKPHCNSNYKGSSGGMECAGMIKIFRRSEEKYNVKYINYIGDGDAKTFLHVQKDQPYGPSIKISKFECIGHVGKRFGYHMRKLKTQMKRQKLLDGKTLFGKGRLTEGWIIKLQTFYTGAIRNNPESISNMMRDIWAIWYHIRSSDSSPQHQFCPIGEDSWCKYQKARATNNLENFNHTKNLPEAVCDAIKPVFVQMSSLKLLKRCLGGHTQNTNESFNSVLWKLCPKTIFVGHKTVKIAANISTVIFNDGMAGFLSIMEKLGMEPGLNAIIAAKKKDQVRIYIAENKANEKNKKLRAAFKRLRVQQQQEFLQKEGNL